MRWPKIMVELVCLGLARILLGVGVCFNLVGTSKRFLYVDHVR
jgi:hypothetical protein